MSEKINTAQDIDPSVPEFEQAAQILSLLGLGNIRLTPDEARKSLTATFPTLSEGDVEQLVGIFCAEGVCE